MVDWSDKKVPKPSEREITVSLNDLKLAFKAMDESGKGEIEAGDVMKLLSELGYTETEAKCLFDQMDVDNNQNISENEFIKGCVNEGVCEIVDPDEALGKASSQSASPDTKVKFVEAAALNEEDKKLARGFYARVLEYVKARDDAEADAAGKAAPAASPAASKPGGIIEVHSVDEFYQVVDGSQVPVVVKFFAKWCRKCMAMGPKYKKIAAGYGGRATFVKIEIEEAGHLAKKESGVVAIPTFQVWKGRAVTDKYVAGSVISKVPGELCEMIDRNLDCGFSLVSEISEDLKQEAAEAPAKGKIKMEGKVEVSGDAMAAWRAAQANKNKFRRPMP